MVSEPEDPRRRRHGGRHVRRRPSTRGGGRWRRDAAGGRLRREAARSTRRGDRRCDGVVYVERWSLREASRHGDRRCDGVVHGKWLRVIRVEDMISRVGGDC